jgi:hypothetical protein
VGAALLAALSATRAAASPTAAPQKPLVAVSQRYALTAELDPETHEVRGTLRLSLTNSTNTPIRSLLLHLYMNAFRDDESVFMRESAGSLRGARTKGRGFIELSSLHVRDEDVLARAEHELIPGDRTQLRVALDAPLLPTETLVLTASFITALPPVFARAGYVDDFHAVTQWFPKLAKLEPDGSFASFPYHARSEFYADFADYSLEIDVPHGYVVGATGRLVSRGEHEGRSRLRFEAHAVHDVAFVAARRASSTQKRLEGVDVIFMHPPGYELALAEHERVIAVGLRHFGLRYGAYPYPTLTVVIPPRGAEGAAGMEYPSLMLTAGSWLHLPSAPWLSGSFVTAHELAHQWFQGLLASNEAAHPVLDEGLAEWAALDLVRAIYGPRAALSAFAPIDRIEAERLGALLFAPPSLPGAWPAHFYTEREYGRTIYARSATVLETVRRAHGRARFERALALYAQRSRFAHPTPADLEAAFDEAYGKGFAASVLGPLLFEGAESAVHLGSVQSRREDESYVTRVRARRTGRVALPTWIALYGERGNELSRRRFAASEGQLELELSTSERVARVVIDPDRALLVDPNVRDQQVTLVEAPHVGLGTQLLALLQTLFAWVGP